MSHLTSANVAYSMFADGEIYVEYVGASELDDVVRSLAALKRLELDGDSPARRLLDLGRTAAYRACSSPLQWNSAILGLAGLADEMSDLLLMLNLASNARTPSAQVRDTVRRMAGMDHNPLASAVVEILATGTPGQVGVVLPTTRHVGATIELLESFGVICPVFTARTVADARCIETLVAIGPPHWYSDAMMTAPRSLGTTFVHLSRGYEFRPSEGLLGQISPRAIRCTSASGTSASITEDAVSLDLAPPLEWIEMVRQVDRLIPAGSGSDCELARLAGMAGGSSAWLSSDPDRLAYTVVFDRQTEAAIVRKRACMLSEGDIVILRSDIADGDFIRAVADVELGAADKREAQLRWKSALQRECDRVGVRCLAERLKSFGVAESNLRHWLRDSSIRPRDKRQFAATCEAIGLIEDIQGLWSTLSAIQGAHIEAGRRTAELLRTALGECDLLQLRQHGVIEIEKPGAGTVGAYAIEHISEIERMVPVGHMHRLMGLEGGQWHE